MATSASNELSDTIKSNEIITAIEGASLEVDHDVINTSVSPLEPAIQQDIKKPAETGATASDVKSGEPVGSPSGTVPVVKKSATPKTGTAKKPATSGTTPAKKAPATEGALQVKKASATGTTTAKKATGQGTTTTKKSPATGTATKKPAPAGTTTQKTGTQAGTTTVKKTAASGPTAPKKTTGAPNSAGSATKTASKQTTAEATDSKTTQAGDQHADSAASPRRGNFFTNLFTRGASIAAVQWMDGDNHEHDHGNDDDDDYDDADDDGDGNDDDNVNDGDHDNGHETNDHQDRDQDEKDGRDDNDNNHEHHHGSANNSKEMAQLAGGVLTNGQAVQPLHRSTPNDTAKSATTRKDTGNKTAEKPTVRVRNVSPTEFDEKKAADGSQITSAPPKLFLGIGFFEVLVKSLNVLFPLFFIALGVLHIVQIGRAQDDTLAQTVSEVRTIAITIWPIMFAAIATQSLKAYGTYQAERGIKLMTLEQLLHSTSFSSAIKQPMLLRRIDWMSVLLFILWGLSPLASQALQRMAFTTQGSSSQALTVNYTRTDLSGLSNHAGIAAASARYPAMFGGAMMTNKRVAHSPQDSWGNPKVPAMEYLQSPDAQGWYNIPNDTQSIDWVSLLGTPHTTDTRNYISGSQFSTNYTFDTGYYTLTCSAWKTFPASQVNISLYSPSPTWGWFLYMDADPNSASFPGTYNKGTLHFAFGDLSGTSDQGTAISLNYDTIDCGFNLLTVTVETHCLSRDSDDPLCQAVRVRPATDSSIAQGYGMSPSTFVYLFTSTAAGAFNGSGSLEEFYLGNPDNIMGGSGTAIANLDPTTFSKRAGVLVNTFYQSSGDQSGYVVGLGSVALNAYVGQGSITDVSPVWTVSIPWIVIIFFCSVSILLFAIADIIWEAYTVSPDFLGFASNVVRNNQHLRKEFQGRKLSGHEKARAMSDLKVVLQDMAPDKAVGKIALAPANASITRLSRQRNYV